jgi:hypothetical protein
LVAIAGRIAERIQQRDLGRKLQHQWRVPISAREPAAGVSSGRYYDEQSIVHGLKQRLKNSTRPLRAGRKIQRREPKNFSGRGVA